MISDAISILDKLVELGKKLKNKKLNEEIMTLQNYMMSIQQRIITLERENHQLKEKLLEKENKNIIFEKGAYFELKQDGTKEGPFCSGCWDKDKKLIRLKETRVGWYDSINNIDDTHQVEICPICKTRRS